jgi:diamine N-acetyltransferase
MDSSIEIRIAARADAELVADISRRTFYDSFARHNSKENMLLFMDQQFTREKQIAEVGAPGRVFLLAYRESAPVGGGVPVGDGMPVGGGVLVGYASLREAEPPPEMAGAEAIEIYQIYAEQGSIGKGVGRALMQACLDIARGLDKEWVWLGVWEHNQRAIDFYYKWGFERFGQHIFMVGNDAQTDWWMKKKL